MARATSAARSSPACSPRACASSWSTRRNHPTRSRGTSYLRGDIAHPVTARRAVATAEAAFGGLDLLVNAATTYHRGDLLSTDITCWNRVLTVNLTGTMLACQAAVPAMGRRGGGAIVNLGAVHPFGDAPDQRAYAISKSAVVALTRELATTLAGRRIRVNCVHTGAGPAARPDKEVADAVLHLLSPVARVTGHILSPRSPETVPGPLHPAEGPAS